MGAFRRESVRRAAADVAFPAVNTIATVTYGALAKQTNIVLQIDGSYNAAPTGGRLYVTDGGTVIFDVDIAAAGPFSFQFDPALEGRVNSAVVVNLAAAGAAVTGKLEVSHATL